MGRLELVTLLSLLNKAQGANLAAQSSDDILIQVGVIFDNDLVGIVGRKRTRQLLRLSSKRIINCRLLYGDSVTRDVMP